MKVCFDPTHQIMSGGADRHQIGGNVDAVLFARHIDSRKALAQMCCVEMPQIEICYRRCGFACSDFLHDGASDNISRCEFRQRVISRHKALARWIEQQCSFSP